MKPPSTFRPSSPPPRPQTLQAPLKGASEGGTSEPAPFVSPLPLSLTQLVVPASHPAPLPLLLHLCCLTMHFPTLFIFVLHRPDRSSSAMVYGLDANHPAPPLLLLRSSHPPLLILFLSLEGTHSVVTLTLVLSLISTKCSRITFPSLSTLRTIATAPTLFPFPRFPPLESTTNLAYSWFLWDRYTFVSS